MALNFKDRIQSKKQKSNDNNITQNNEKILGLSQEQVNSLMIYNQQIAQNLYGVQSRALTEQVNKNLQVFMSTDRIHQFTESRKQNIEVGRHSYVSALPINSNIAPTSRTFMQDMVNTPIDSHSFLQKDGLQFNGMVVSAMLFSFNDPNVEIVWEKFKSLEHWVLDNESEEVKYILGEVAKVFNFFSGTSVHQLRQFINIKGNVERIVILLDMLNIEYFTLMYNWLVAQDILAVRDLFNLANANFEEYYRQKNQPNYTNMYSEKEIIFHDIFMNSTRSLYERIRCFKSWGIIESVFGKSNQDILKGFLDTIGIY